MSSIYSVTVACAEALPPHSARDGWLVADQPGVLAEIDDMCGYALAPNARVLVFGLASSITQGLYTLRFEGSDTTPWRMEPAFRERVGGPALAALPGTRVRVVKGTTYAGRWFIYTGSLWEVALSPLLVESAAPVVKPVVSSFVHAAPRVTEPSAPPRSRFALLREEIEDK